MSEKAVSGEVGVTVAERRPHVLKRLYNWVLHWADTSYGTPALAAIAFAESSIFPIPPDVLQIPLSISKPRRSYFYAVVSTCASVLGGALGWMIGFFVWSVVKGFFFDWVPGFTPSNNEIVRKLYHENAFLYIVFAGFTPIPYKVFTITAGAVEVQLEVLLAASLVGRSARFFAVATCIFFFGSGVKYLLDKYFGLATFALGVLFVLGILAIKIFF